MNLQGREPPTVDAAHIALDAAGKIWHWDSAAERLFGWPAELALGQTACDLLSPDRLRDERAALFERVLVARASSDRSLAFRRRDGREIPVDVVRRPIVAVSGKVLGIVLAYQLARPQMAGVAQWEPDDRPTTAQEALAAREIEVVRYVAQGLTNREIGDAMGISAGSVSNYIDRIFEKLGFHRRAELASWSVGVGLSRFGGGRL